MPLIGSATGDHLDLRPAGLIKIRRLPKGADFEFFYRFDRGCHHTRGHAVGLATGETGEVLDVSDGVARHIVGVIAAIDRECVLIHVAAGDIASGRHSGLKRQQGCCVAAKVRQ